MKNCVWILKKVKAVLDWVQSTNLKEIQDFIDFTNFYCQFIQDFFKIVKSLINLIRKKILFV